MPQFKKPRDTRDVIEDALITLLQEQPMDKITTTRICQAANVSRGTFYHYYLDPDDCFETLQNTLYNQMNANTPLFDQQHPEVFITALLTTFQENARLMKALLRENHTDMLVAFMRRHQRLTTSRTNPADHYATYEMAFYTDGILNVCRHWLSWDMPETPAELARIILTIIFQASKNLPAPRE